jgi:hypothetical protein
MFVKSKHAKGVTRMTLLRALFYVYVHPKNGFLKKLRERFGSGARLVLNTELALTLVIKNIPNREPGMFVGIDVRNVRRFTKIVEKLGLKVMTYEGERELVEVANTPHVIAVIVPDSFSAMSERRKSKFERSNLVKVIYQNKKRPKSVDLMHDVYIWEPKALPRSSCGAVVVLANESLETVRQALRTANTERQRMTQARFIQEIFNATKGYENKYRRIDKSPPRVLARMLYDFYK